MAHNNDALYDAVVAGAGGGAQNGWLVLSTPASYTPFATNIDILATAVDLQIPTVAGGPSISQINLLQSITQSVLTARYPVPSVPATYVDIAKAIAAVYTELAKLLTNQPAVASYGVNWLVANWYIDGVTGNDANSGVVIGAPLKTGAELLRRLGPYAMWPQSVTVNVLANGMTDALVLRGLMMVAGNHLDVVGTPTQVADAGTIATYAAVNHATPTATQITSTLIADWTAHQWKRIRTTAGARVGTVAWIACSNPAGVGVATARICVPTIIDTVSANSTTGNSTFVAGDPVVIESIPFVPELTLVLDGAITNGGASQYARRLWSITHINCPLVWINTPAELHGRKSVFFGCAVSAVGQAGMALSNSSFSVTVTGSLVYGYDLSVFASISDVVRLANVLVGNGLTTIIINDGIATQNVLCQGTAVSAGTAIASAFQVFDTIGAATVAFAARTAIVTNLSGSGNAGFGIGIGNLANCRMAGTINLQGAVSNARLTSAVAVNLTIPQLLQPDDYAQKGITPAMVAGTTTVTVPWYDNATQQVTVSHAVFAGTPGILSVQQISTTQFTITSSSALDTSTVRWQISPLGRNIFISTS